MKSVKEIREYLGIDPSLYREDYNAKAVRIAQNIEKEYATKLGTGEYGYCFRCDFEVRFTGEIVKEYEDIIILYKEPNSNQDLIDTIKQDCKYYEQLVNNDAMINSYMYLNICNNSTESGLYQLILNGCELWYGTLPEINAIVKSMIKVIEKKEDYSV